MSEGERIVAAEAAARLGVKRETLYAYVSRGMLSSRRGLDGKSSTFDAAEVADLRRRRSRRRDGGLDAVVSSGITRVADGSLRYRGHDVEALVPLGFEAVADLLWSPVPEPPVPDRPARWPADPNPPTATAALDLGPLPGIDRLRLAAVVASGQDPLRHDRTAAAVARIGRRVLGAYIEALPVRGRDRAGSVANRLWPRLTSRRAGRRRIAALDAALVLLADHDLASSTVAARVAASVRADPYSVVLTGLGALGGPLHGAASAGVHDLFDRAHRLGSRDALGEALRRDRPLPGFGHAVYRRSDPRYATLNRAVHEAFAGDRRLDVVDELTGLARGRTDDVANVDLALGSLTWLAGMDPDAGEVIFAVSRTVGWLAHGAEEYGEQPLRFRPRSLPR